MSAQINIHEAKTHLSELLQRVLCAARRTYGTSREPMEGEI
jgi:hypothetical protein